MIVTQQIWDKERREIWKLLRMELDISANGKDIQVNLQLIIIRLKGTKIRQGKGV